PAWPARSPGLWVMVGRAPRRAQGRIADPAAVAPLLGRRSAPRAEHLDRDRACAGSRDGRSPALAGDLGLEPPPPLQRPLTRQRRCGGTELERSTRSGSTV